MIVLELVYLADSVHSGRNFVTHALPVAQEHIMTPLHVVLWTKTHNSSYIHYNTPFQKLVKEGFVYAL